MDRNHWSAVARLWSLLGPPMRPSPEDVAIAASTVRAWQEEHAAGPPTALILGVTPELASLPWPPGTRLSAIDASEAMVEALWPRESVPPGSVARTGDWRALDLPGGSVDLVLGDGCFTALGSPAELRRVVVEARRVMRPGGRLVLRVFVRPDVPEEVDAMGEALRAGRIGSVHAFKWRLCMAVQRPDARQVAVADVWQAFRRICPDPSELVARLGWAPEAVATLDAYRDSAGTYSFPTLAEHRALLAPDFTERSCHVPGYELGDRCPTLVLEPRERA